MSELSSSSKENYPASQTQKKGRRRRRRRDALIVRTRSSSWPAEESWQRSRRKKEWFGILVVLPPPFHCWYILHILRSKCYGCSHASIQLQRSSLSWERVMKRISPFSLRLLTFFVLCSRKTGSGRRRRRRGWWWGIVENPDSGGSRFYFVPLLYTLMRRRICSGADGQRASQLPDWLVYTIAAWAACWRCEF